MGADCICLMMNKYGMVWVGGWVKEMIQEPLMHGEYKECPCSMVTSLLGSSQGISLWKAWDWLLGLVPSVPGKEISWKTALAVAVLGGGHTWSRIRCSAWRDAAQSSRARSRNGINMAQAVLVVSSPQEKKWELGAPSFHIPAAPCWSVQGS